MENVPSKASAACVKLMALVKFWSEYTLFFFMNVVNGEHFILFNFPGLGEVLQAGLCYPGWVVLPSLGKI